MKRTQQHQQPEVGGGARNPAGDTNAGAADDETTDPGGGAVSANPNTITVLIAEDDPLIREVLSSVIGGDIGFDVSAMVGDAETAILSAIKHAPDLVLLDVRMPGGGGAHAAREISEMCPASRIVAISAHDDPETIGEMVSAGASGYVTKDAPPEQMLDTLRRCAAGESIFTPISAGSMMRDFMRNSQRIELVKRERREREERLRRAFDPGSIVSVFQPIVDLQTGEIQMYEALTRFHADSGKSTFEWFEEAVELGMSSELELAALTQTVNALARVGGGSFNVSLNVSPETLLNPLLSSTISAIAPERIVIEITEYAKIVDYAETKATIARLRERGVRLAIDDAGAGFASLRHILNLEPNLIKLDISLVRDIDSDQPRRALATGLISFAREINADIVAEGIETAAELDVLRGLGASLGQGYILAKPAPIEQSPVGQIDLTML